MKRSNVITRTLTLHRASSSQNLSISAAGEHFHGYYSLGQEHFKATWPKCIELHCCLTVAWECRGVVVLAWDCLVPGWITVLISLFCYIWRKMLWRCVAETVMLCLHRLYYGEIWLPVPSKAKLSAWHSSEDSCLYLWNSMKLNGSIFIASRQKKKASCGQISSLQESHEYTKPFCLKFCYMGLLRVF